MADYSDVLLAMYQENAAQKRHHEEQRATITKQVIATCVGVLALLAARETPPWLYLILSIILVVLGTFGGFPQLQTLRALSYA